MRWLVMTLALLVIVGCQPAPSAVDSSITKSETGSAGAAHTATLVAPTKDQLAAAGKVSSVRLLMDGKEFALDPGVTQEQKGGGAGNAVLSVLAGNYRSQLGAGYGVTLKLQSPPNKGVFKEGFNASDVEVIEFTVWKSNDFSYTSNGRIPGQAIKGLQLDTASGRLKGSFESSISGLIGKYLAKVEFDVAFPK